MLFLYLSERDHFYSVIKLKKILTTIYKTIKTAGGTPVLRGDFFGENIFRYCLVRQHDITNDEDFLKCRSVSYDVYYHCSE